MKDGLADPGAPWRMGQQSSGLEAAHLKWYRAHGVDEVPNGIAMCALHHRVFDLGAFKILPQTHPMVFSQHFNGSEAASPPHAGIPRGQFNPAAGPGVLPTARQSGLACQTSIQKPGAPWPSFQPWFMVNIGIWPTYLLIGVL